MTVGELSRRTGLSIKAIREYEALGLIYSDADRLVAFLDRGDPRPDLQLVWRDPAP